MRNQANPNKTQTNKTPKPQKTKHEKPQSPPKNQPKTTRKPPEIPHPNKSKLQDALRKICFL